MPQTIQRYILSVFTIFNDRISDTIDAHRVFVNVDTFDSYFVDVVESDFCSLDFIRYDL